MQDNVLFDCKYTKKASVLNFVGVVLFFLLVIAFFICLFTGVVGSGVDNSDGKNEGLTFGFVLVVFLPFLLIGLGLSLLTVIYKIIFAIILSKFCADARVGQVANVAKGLFVASAVLKIINVFLTLAMGLTIFAIVDAGKTPVLAGVFVFTALTLVALEIITLLMENKAKKEAWKKTAEPEK